MFWNMHNTIRLAGTAPEMQRGTEQPFCFWRCAVQIDWFSLKLPNCCLINNVLNWLGAGCRSPEVHLQHSRLWRLFKDYDIISLSDRGVFACLDRWGFAHGSYYPEGLGALFNQEEVRARGHWRMIPRGLFSSKSVLAPLSVVRWGS